MLENLNTNNCTCIFQSQTTLNSSFLFLCKRLVESFPGELEIFLHKNLLKEKKQALIFSRSAGQQNVPPFTNYDIHALLPSFKFFFFKKKNPNSPAY